MSTVSTIYVTWVVSSAAGLIITVTDGEGEVIEREAGCATGPGPVAHDGGRSFCATAAFAGLDGADLIRRCMLTYSSGVATSEGTWRLKPKNAG